MALRQVNSHRRVAEFSAGPEAGTFSGDVVVQRYLGIAVKPRKRPAIEIKRVDFLLLRYDLAYLKCAIGNCLQLSPC